MAIKTSDYARVKNEANLKIHKTDKTKFLFDFRIEGKRYRKAFKIKNTGWDKKTCIKEAKRQLQIYKDDIEAGYTSSDKINLDRLKELYFENLKDTKWKTIKEGIYIRYIQNTLGKKSIKDIKPMQIEKILKKMDKEGLSPRTQKSILEVLKPLFKFALQNKMIKEIPTTFINVKIPNQKKIVTNATELFTRVHNGIVTLYKDDPFYQALFLFGFSGRRKSEILNLRWENIDFTNSYYWITNTKNDDNQRYPLPSNIKPLLLQFKERQGLVFPSPTTGKPIVNIDRQMRRLKEHTGIDNLSLHYMRNILVSMLAEHQTEAITLSGILGHKDVNTINKYLSINHFKSGTEGLKIIDKIIDVEVK